MMRARRIGIGFYGLLVLASLLTFVVHEAAHWLAGMALGHEMIVTLNGAHSTTPVAAVDQMLISAAGPAVTVLQAMIALGLVLKRGSLAAYAFLYAAAFMRFAAAVVSLMNPNDEARISLFLGWGMWTLPAIVVVGLAAMTWAGSRSLKLSWKTNLLAYVVVSAAIAAIVGADMLGTR